MAADIRDLIRITSSTTPSDDAEFNRLRLEAMDLARKLWDDRAKSYNVDKSAMDEMPFGIVSHASEMFKRVKRLCSIVTPMRRDAFRAEDVARLEDTYTDMINYAAWGWAITQMAKVKLAAEEREADITRALGAKP